MQSENSAGKTIAVSVILIVLIGIGVATWKFIGEPWMNKRLVEQTSSDVKHKTPVKIGMDSFVGYAILRSPRFQERLAKTKEDIGIVVKNDEANYPSRAKALKSGELDMAVFTIDADIVTGADLGEFSGSMIFVIDETKGADGIVAYEKAVPNVSALNRTDAKIIATPDSPSETLTRHLIAGMLPVLVGKSWLIEAKGSDDVYAQMKTADQSLPRAYALWEPSLSKALELPGVKVLYDTSKVSGAVVDVLIVNRKYLSENPQIVRTVMEAYFHTLNEYTSEKDGMVQLVINDAKLSGETLSETQAKKIVSGIQWKNTLENYAHMGLLSAKESQGLLSVRDMIYGISSFLVKTGKLKSNPTLGHEQELYSNKTLADMKAANFRPGTGQMADIRTNPKLCALTPEEWDKLIYVGDMDARTIDFERARATLTIQGERDVKALLEQLRSWPNYYLSVIGHARPEGDPAANLELAKARGKTVEEAIVAYGFDRNCIRSIAEPSQQQNGGAQSVTFRLSQKAY
jgi:ABC-type nitrate/sulfonate/bicarbonate transport system substrate-binding protein/outer membrane protein OmpA-like peptidoglycan-associated protein